MDTAARERTARRAFDAYTAALETGDATPSATCSPPTPRSWSLPRGSRLRPGPCRHRADPALAARRAAPGRCGSPRRIALGDNTAAFEFEFCLAGTLADEPYRTHATVVCQVSDDRVIGLREYYGDNTLPAESFAQFGLEDSPRARARLRRLHTAHPGALARPETRRG